jgi:hypothetical protein
MAELSEADLRPPKEPSSREFYPDGWDDYERRRIQLRKTNTGDLTRAVLEAPLRKVVASWRFPLHFIDFETTRVAIPFHQGMRPYEQLAFQFSHHVVHESGLVEHRNDWINTDRGKFPNFDLLRELRGDLSSDMGTIFRYAPHQNSVLCDIVSQLQASSEPDREELIEWTKTITHKKGAWKGERDMVDLLQIVRRYYYHPLMGSSNSIKAVLPAILRDSEHLKAKYSRPIYGVSNGIKSRNFTDLAWNHTWVETDASGCVIDPYAILKRLSGTIGGYDYDRLEWIYADDEIADGGAAMTAYAMMQFTQMGDAEHRALTASLLRYCELDTLAMVMLYEYWCEILGMKDRVRAAA